MKKMFLIFAFWLPMALYTTPLHAQNTSTQPTPQTNTATATQTAPPAPYAPPFPGLVPVGPDGVPQGGVPQYMKPETPEQRMARIGLSEDPGVNPDPSKVYWRFGHPMSIHHLPRRWANYETLPQEGWLRTFGPVNTYQELYQQNAEWVWYWQGEAPPQPQEELEPGTRENPAPIVRELSDAQIEYFKKIRPEFEPLDVPDSGVTIHFHEASNGLPNQGSYRNGLAVADMNGDGCPDIIAPPQRGLPNGLPEIYLGDCKGNWRFWQGVKWPYTLDYGTVVAADFNKDGHMDLAFAVHLTGVFVFLGDGKGNFVDASSGLPRNYPTRRLVVTDADGDGYPDLAIISEGPTARSDVGADLGKIRVYYNRNKGKSWVGTNVAGPRDQFGGDWLSAGKFNGDKYPDFVAASVYFNGPDILWLSTGPRKWKSVGGGTVVPFLSYHFANTTGHFSSKKRDDAIISFVRSWPSESIDKRIIPDPPATRVVGLDRISFAGPPTRTPIVRWGGPAGAIWGLASGDFDGDGNLDLMYTRYDPRALEILLGDGKGHFKRAKIEGVTLAPNTNYDLEIADVNGDGRPDVIIAYESSSVTALAVRDGSIHVFLNEGTEKPEKK